MRVAIATIAREPNYFARTWRELFASDASAPQKVDVYVGSPDTSHLAGLDQSRMIVHTTSAEDWERLHKMPSQKRAAWNLLRALSTPPDSEGLVVLEDDITFAFNWLQSLRAGAKEAPGHIISGYTPPGVVPQSSLLGSYGSFYASLCVLFPGDSATQVHPKVQNAVTQAGLPFDVALNYAGKPILGLINSCVDHTGDLSTIDGHTHRRAAYFVSTEQLNRDHHARMSEQEASWVKLGISDAVHTHFINSRDALLQAMLGCINRYSLWPPEGQRTVLELGAGFMRDKPVLEATFGAKFFGIEVVREVAERFADEGVVHGAVESMPPEWADKFDFVYSRHVMEHVSDPDLALQEVRRVMRTGGVVGAITPHELGDNEPAHQTKLGFEWMDKYREHGLDVRYIVERTFLVPEVHVVAVAV